MKVSSGRRALDKVYKRRDRYETPNWQREKVWGTAKKQLLIDSILRGWKLPKFYFLKTSDDPEEHEVVDGQQRLNAIFEFFGNQLPLSAESQTMFGGKFYKDLSASASDVFDDFEIEYDEITDADEAEVREYFQRLQKGMQLNASENLNAIPSQLRDHCRKLANHNFFAKKVSFPNKRYAFFDVASKVTTIEINGIDTGLRYDDIKEAFDSQKGFSSSSPVAKRVDAAMEYVNRAFDTKNPVLRNRTMVQSIVSLASRIAASGRGAGSEKKFREFIEGFVQELTRQVELGKDATDQDYIEFQRSVSANVRGTAKTRQEILLRKLLQADPSFATVLGPAAVTESGITQDITRLSDSIGELVEKINDAHAAERGEDLFKATNKTNAALKKIAKPARDYKSYKSFVENLYFLFWEGSGGRLVMKPDAFQDINALRTDLDHDVDHGDAGKVRAKRKKISKTFGKYASTATPSTLEPEHFPAVQAKMLTAVKKALQAILTAGFTAQTVKAKRAREK